MLAAGAGTRFAGPGHKLLALMRGRPIVVWAVTAALEAGLAETIVVGGAVDLGPALADHGLADRVRLVVNPELGRGPGHVAGRRDRGGGCWPATMRPWSGWGTSPW